MERQGIEIYGCSAHAIEWKSRACNEIMVFRDLTQIRFVEKNVPNQFEIWASYRWTCYRCFVYHYVMKKRSGRRLSH